MNAVNSLVRVPGASLLSDTRERAFDLRELRYFHSVARTGNFGRSARELNISQPAISKHLKVLERAGLISRGRDAQRRPCRIEARPLAEANVWLEGYRKIWQANFQRLDNLLDEMATHEKPRRRR